MTQPKHEGPEPWLYKGYPFGALQSRRDGKQVGHQACFSRGVGVLRDAGTEVRLTEANVCSALSREARPGHQRKRRASYYRHWKAPLIEIIQLKSLLVPCCFGELAALRSAGQVVYRNPPTGICMMFSA